MSLEHYVRSVTRAVGLQLLLVVVLTAATFTYLLLRVGPDLEAAINNSRTVRVIHEAMLDQESSLRGSLLTPDEAVRAPYEEGRKRMIAATATADDAIGSSGRFGQAYMEMRLAQQRWVEEWAARAEPGRTFYTEEERTDFINAGRELFDDYRQKQERLIAELTGERQRLLDHQQVVLATAATIAFVSGIFLLIVTFRERHRINELVVDPVVDMQRVMERLSFGDFTARTAGIGATEMRTLAASLDDMSDRLHDALRTVAEQQASMAARTERQGQILSMARNIAGSLNLGYVLKAVAEQSHRLTAPSVTTVWLVDDSAEAPTLVQSWRHTDDESREGTEVVELGQGLAGEVARDGRGKSADERGTPAVAIDFEGEIGALAVPMIVGAQVVGVIESEFLPPRPIDSEMVVMVETLASHAGTAIEAARLHEATRELSQMDGLTKLYNRRRLDADLADELARSQRHGRPLAFVMADLDHFKSFNDTYGHQRGDEVLQEVARILSAAVRETDTVYRYGGEELSILLRETTIDEAVLLAERLRESIARHFAARGEQRAVTLSIGVSARHGRDPASAADLVAAADRALYEAKATGRDRVVMANDAATANAAVAADGGSPASATTGDGATPGR